MRPAEAEQLGGRLGHEMVTAYFARVRFEARITAAAVWGKLPSEEGGADTAAVEASDDELEGLGIAIKGR